MTATSARPTFVGVGYYSLGKVLGVPVQLHWSALLGALFFGGFRFAPGAWLGFLLVIGVHELGHALVVRRTGQRVIGVNVHGLGGECAWQGDPSPIQRACIAWGGVWAQLVVFVIALPILWWLGPALASAPVAFGFVSDLAIALTWSNLWLAALNLIPYGPLDGVEAWKLPELLLARWRGRKRRRAEERVPPAVASILEDIARQAREARRPKR